MRVPLAILVLAAGCGEDVNVEALPDYHDPSTGWTMLLEVHGNAPGHSDSIRFIWGNPIANGTAPPLPGPPTAEFGDVGMPLGSILVKEVYADDNGVQGALRHIAIMRKQQYVGALEAEGGWLYTEIDKPTDPEKTYDLCWGRCHASAPFNGAFYDYTKL